MRFAVVLAILLVNYGASCKDTEAELQRLPKLYHLDDYETCMARTDGIFCLGIFEIYSDLENNPLYDLIQEKAQDIRLYNRTLLHRGYCLPKRCPSRDANTTARFERCVDAYAQKSSLRARLRTLHSCRAHGQPPAFDTNDTPHRAFLYAVYAYLVLNALGTFYDFQNGNNSNKNQILMMFSLRANWKKLTTINDSGPENLIPFMALNGLKAFLLIGAVVAHVGVVATQYWQYNPRFMEKFLASPAGGIIGALTTSTQAFVLISNFLNTYNLLLFSEKIKIGFSLIPILFIKRVTRMLPIYILLNAFSATWWTKIGDGPLWPLIVESESKICRDKFWPQVFFLQNMFEPNRFCNVQTWVMAVDMQLYIPSLIITILLIKRREWAVPMLSILLFGATVATGYVALTRQYMPAFYYMTPENFRELCFNSQRDFYEFFVKPINCIITMMLGIILGYIYYNKQQQEAKDKKKIKPSKLSLTLHFMSLPMIFIWSYFCTLLIPITDPVFMALMMPVERVAHALFMFQFIYTSHKVRSLYTRVLAWRGLRFLSRLSLSISMVHWCVNKTLVATRSTLLDASQVMLMMDTIGISFISVILAIPLTVIIEYPTSNVIDKLLSRFI